MPIGGRSEREVSRKKRVGGRRQARGEDEERGEGGLRDEEPGDALQVPQDLPASRTIAGTDAKSPRTSTRSATLFAICVPAPCAIASRGEAFSAGTSLTPSPTMAT